VREFPTPAAFRAAVESRLRDRARSLGIPSYVLRRHAALERLMVRLDHVAPGRWALKGGLALETRLGAHARVSVDLDADHVLGGDAARADLQQAAVAEAGDYFDFALTGSQGLIDSGVRLAIRYALESSLAGRPFEPLQVDVTLARPEPWDAQPALRPGLLRELGLGPIPVLLIPVARQVAEKLHAYTRVYKGRGTTRAKDLVDLLLVLRYERVEVDLLQEAIVRVFQHRGTHPVPESLPPPPRDLVLAFRKEAARVAIVPELDAAARQLAVWINPLLRAIRQSKELE
jgi:predicted nucleotidyltransferase component of viral defense system